MSSLRIAAQGAFAAGLTAEQILEEMPDPEMEDLKVALRYSARCL